MTSQPDKFFRDKLENFQQPAPSEAWNRIESNLSRPAHKLIWIRVAAGAALLTAATIALWPSEKSEIKIADTSSNNTVTKKDPVLQPGKVKDQEKTGTAKHESAGPAQKINTETFAGTQKQLKKPISNAQDSVVIISLPEIPQSIAEVAQVEEVSASKTIVYTAEEVNARFLKKKLPPQATPESQEASGIQKLIGLAYDAKNSEAPLGSLRQKKDDILALNFGKKKGEN